MLSDSETFSLTIFHSVTTLTQIRAYLLVETRPGLFNGFLTVYIVKFDARLLFCSRFVGFGVPKMYLLRSQAVLQDW